MMLKGIVKISTLKWIMSAMMLKGIVKIYVKMSAMM